MIPAELLRRIPGCEDGRPALAVFPLPGGRGCNQVLRVDTVAGRFVWRRRRPPIDRPGSSALLELRSQQLAATAGLAPPVLAAAPDGEWLVMPFEQGALWNIAQLQSAQGAETLGARLGALHGLKVPADWPDLDAPGIARGYLSLLAARDPAAARDCAPLASRVEVLSADITASGGRRALNHGDLQVSNFVGAAPVLVDWEYAQIADPCYDMACLLAYYPALARWQEPLLQAAGYCDAQFRARLALERARFTCLNVLWERVHLAKLDN